MATRAELMAESEELIALYRQVARETPTPLDLVDIGLTIGRALEALEQPRGMRDSLDRAEADLAAARQMLARIPRSSHR